MNDGVCTVDAAARRRRKVLNLLGSAFVLAVLAYVAWMIVVELVGLGLGIM